MLHKLHTTMSDVYCNRCHRYTYIWILLFLTSCAYINVLDITKCGYKFTKPASVNCFVKNTKSLTHKQLQLIGHLQVNVNTLESVIIQTHGFCCLFDWTKQLSLTYNNINITSWQIGCSRSGMKIGCLGRLLSAVNCFFKDAYRNPDKNCLSKLSPSLFFLYLKF